MAGAKYKVGVGIDDGEVVSKMQKDTELVQDLAKDIRDQADAINQAAEKRAKDIGVNGNYKKVLRDTMNEVQNLTMAYRNLSNEEKSSAIGQAMARRLEEAKAKAADLTDAIGDLREEVRNMASDTMYTDALADGVANIRDVFGALMAVQRLTGADTDALSETVDKLGSVYLAANGVIKVFTMFQKQSSLMVAANAVVNKAAAAAIALRTAAEKAGIIATREATVATGALNMVMKASPYVLIATVIIGAATALYSWVKANQAAKKEEEAHQATLKKLREENEKFYKNSGSQAAQLVTKYKKLAEEWTKLSSTAAKNKWIKENANEFKNLGLKILSVSDAENAFVKNSGKVVQALQLRARAMALEQRALDAYNDYYEKEEEYSTYKRKVWHKGETVPRETLEKAGVRPDAMSWSGDKTLERQQDIDAVNAYEARKAQKLNQDLRTKNKQALDKRLADNKKFIDKAIADQKRLGLGNLMATGTETPSYPETKKTSGSSSKKEEEKALKGSLEALQNERAELEKILKKGTHEKHGKTIDGIKAEIEELDRKIADTQFRIEINADPAKASLEAVEEEYQRLYNLVRTMSIDFTDKGQLDKINKKLTTMFQGLVDKKYSMHLDVNQPEDALYKLYMQLDDIMKKIAEAGTHMGDGMDIDIKPLIAEFDAMYAELQAKKVELKVPLSADVSSLDNVLLTAVRNIEQNFQVVLPVDADTEEAQQKIAQVQQSAKMIKSAMGAFKKVSLNMTKAEPSLDAMEKRLEEIRKQLTMAVNIDDTDIKKAMEEMRQLYKDIKDKRIKLNVDVIANDEKLKNIDDRLAKTQTTPKQSSFEKAVGTPAPNKRDYEGQLEAIQRQMDFNDSLMDQLKDIQEAYKELGDAGAEGYAKVTDQIKKTTEEQEKLAKSAQDVNKANKKQKKGFQSFEYGADAVMSMGDAFKSLSELSGDDEALNVAGTIAQAMANIGLAISTAILSAALTGNPFVYVAMAAAIIALGIALASQISSISNGYATGGIVGGNSYTGDKVQARLNSREMVLNLGLLNRLWNMLNGNGIVSGPDSGLGDVQFVLRGSDLYGSMRNFGKMAAKTGKNIGIH